jgi:iron complex transport system substrate-binding protein
MESLFALGAGSLVVGRSIYCDYPAAASGVEIVPVNSGPGSETPDLASWSPDLVIVDDRGQLRDSTGASKWKGKVFTYFPRNFVELADAIMELGILAGKKDAGIRVAAQLTRAVRSVTLVTDRLPTSRKTKVLWVSSVDPLRTCGANSLFHALVEAAGGRDVFADKKGTDMPIDLDALAGRSVEAMVIAEPSRASAERLKEAGIDSYMDSARVLRLGPGLGTRCGPRSALALFDLARFLHPEVFP